MKGKAALPGLTVVRLKQSCDFFRMLGVTNRKIQSQYLTHNSIKSHAVRYQALKDMKNRSRVAKLTKLFKSTDVLSWMNEVEKHLLRLPALTILP